MPAAFPIHGKSQIARACPFFGEFDFVENGNSPIVCDSPYNVLKQFGRLIERPRNLTVGQGNVTAWLECPGCFG